MKSSGPNDARMPGSSNHASRWAWIIVSGCLLITLIAIFLPRPNIGSSDRAAATNQPSRANRTLDRAARIPSVHRRSNPATESTLPKTAEEIVAIKVGQFVRNRREIVRAISRRTNQEVPAEIEAFFDAVEAGNWEDIDSRWQGLAKRSGQYENSTHSPEFDQFWPAVLDAFGVAEQAHEWPAQKLLDYGEAVLGSLRPGMVYVGGTDNGRWVPELLNETGEGEHHIIVTQNALADGRYVDFVKTLYGERMTTLTSEDSQGIFQEYIADAQKRLEHDQQFPDEPKQLRQGEDIHVVDGKVQVSGQVAVTAINERLLQTLMQKNPELSFAIQESFPLKGTYPDALPLGPLMELGARNEQNSFTPERAGQSIDYWRNTRQKLF